MILEEMPKGVDFFNATVCMIFFKDGRTIILQKRLDHPIYPGKWGFPAGKVKPTDTSIATATLREVQEETGNIYEASDLIGPIVVPAKHQKMDGQDFYFYAFIFGIRSENGFRVKLDEAEHKSSLIVPWRNVLKTQERYLIPDAQETLILFRKKYRL